MTIRFALDVGVAPTYVSSANDTCGKPGGGVISAFGEGSTGGAPTTMGSTSRAGLGSAFGVGASCNPATALGTSSRAGLGSTSVSGNAGSSSQKTASEDRRDLHPRHRKHE